MQVESGICYRLGEECCFTKINPIGNRSACPEVSVSSYCITVCLPPSSNPPSSWAVVISFSLLSQHRIFKKASKEASEHSQCMACHFLSVRLSGWMSPFSCDGRMARTVPSLAPPLLPQIVRCGAVLLPQIVRCGAVLLPQLVAAMVGASESDESMPMYCLPSWQRGWSRDPKPFIQHRKQLRWLARIACGLSMVILDPRQGLLGNRGGLPYPPPPHSVPGTSIPCWIK